MSFLTFAVGGVLGFIVDGGAFTLLGLVVANPYLVRVGSFLLAVTTTWAFNRRYAFGILRHPRLDVASAAEWFRYVLSQLTGFSVNYIVFSGLVFFTTLCASWPVLAIGVGSFSGLVVNYLSARVLVFRHSRHDRRSPS